MKTIITILIFTSVMASSALAADILGNHTLSNDRGLVTVQSVEGNNRAFDAIYAPVNGKLVVLTDVFADYDSQTQRAIYSEDRLCPDALKIIFQDNGKVVLHEAACADF